LLGGFARRLLAGPSTARVNNARLLPTVRYQKGFFTGGVFDGAGYRKDLQLYRGSGEKRTAHVSPPEDRAFPAAGAARLERAWFGGYLFDHYGHFILEGLARSVTPEVIASPDPIVFFDMMRIATLRPFMRDAFQLCGVAPERVHLCNAPLEVASLLVQEPAFEIRGLVRPAAYASVKVPEPAERRGVVYLSRSRLGRVRQIDGEDLLEQELVRSFGAEIVYPETLPFAQQIDVLGRAAHVIGCEGSAFHSFIFLRRALQAIVIGSNVPHLDYLLCDEVFDGETVYICAPNESAAQRDRSHWSIDVSKALRLVGRALERSGASPSVSTPASSAARATHE